MHLPLAKYVAIQFYDSGHRKCMIYVFFRNDSFIYGSFSANFMPSWISQSCVVTAPQESNFNCRRFFSNQTSFDMYNLAIHRKYQNTISAELSIVVFYFDDIFLGITINIYFNAHFLRCVSALKLQILYFRNLYLRHDIN